MDEGKRDFKAVKVRVRAGQKTAETVSRSVMFSGVNIFGELSRQYMASKEEKDAAELEELATATASESAAEEAIGLQNEEVMVFKKITKKDPITRCKALKQLEPYFDKDSEKSQKLPNVITFFLYHYQRIMVYEPDTQVREAAQRTFAKFAGMGGALLGKHMNQIFPVWFCTFFDPSAEVSRLGRQCFEENIAGAAEGRLFRVSYRHFLHFADEHLKQDEQQLTEDQLDLTKRQREEVYDRVISQVLMALAESFDVVQQWAGMADQQAQFYKKLVSYLGLKSESQEEEQITEKKKGKKSQKDSKKRAGLWRLLSKGHRPRVRAACLQFVCQFIKYVPEELSVQHVEQIAPAIFEMVQEDSSAIQGCLWRDAYFILGSKFPFVWTQVNLKKAFIPGLMVCLKNAAFGAPSPLYQNLVRFASVFPVFRLVDYEDDKQNKISVKDRSNFYSQFFQSLYAGRKNDEAGNYHQSLTGAYFESLTFLLEKRFLPFAKSREFNFEDADLKHAWTQIKTVLEMPGIDFIKKYEKKSSEVLNQRNVRQTIPMRYNIFGTAIVGKKLGEEITGRLLEAIHDLIAANSEEPNAIRLLKSFINFEKRDPLATQMIVYRFLTGEFADLTAQLKEVNAQTVEGLAQRSRYLQRMLRCLQKNDIEGPVFQSIRLAELLNCIKDLDQTEQRAEKFMSKQAFLQLKMIKNQLLLIAILSMQRRSEDFDESEDATAFFKHVLQDSQQIEAEIKNYMLMPSQPLKELSFKVNEGRARYYFEMIGKNSGIVLQYVIQSIVQKPDDIEKNYETLRGIIKMADDVEGSISSDEANQVATQIQEVLSRCNDGAKSFYLLSVGHLICQPSGARSTYKPELINSFQESMIRAVVAQRSGRTNRSQRAKVWKLMEAALQQEGAGQLLDRCIVGFKDALAKELVELAEESKASPSQLNITLSQVQTIDDFAQMLKQFSMLCAASERQAIIERIVLDEQNFQDCELNCLPMKLFRDLFLQGGLAFDIQNLFSQEQGLKFAWLATLLLSISDMASLNNFPDLKRQLTVFLNTEVVPALLNSIRDGNTELLFKIIETIKQKIDAGDQTAIHTLENVLQKVVDPGEDFGATEPLMKVDDFKKIFSILCQSKAAAIFDKKTESVSIVDLTLTCSVFKVIAYYILDEAECVGLMKQVKKNLHIDFLTKEDVNLRETTYSLSIYLSLFRHFKTDYDPEMQEFVTQWIIGNFKDQFFEAQGELDKSFQLSVLLQFLSAMTEEMGMNKFNNVISYIPGDTLMLSKQKKIQVWKEEQKRIREEAEKKREEEKQKQEEGAEEGSQPAQEDAQADAVAKETEFMQEFQSSLEEMILQIIQLSTTIELSPSTFMNLLTLIRKVIANEKIITERSFLIGEIIEIAKDKASKFDVKLKNLVNIQQAKVDGEGEAQIEQNHLNASVMHQEDSMLQNFSDTLMACTPYINEDVNENSLYVLLNSGFTAIQKAAFFMLAHLYENHIPKVLFTKDADAEIQQLQLISANQQQAAEPESSQIQSESGETEVQDEPAKEKAEFKNVSPVLVEQIENPPSIDDEEGAERADIADNDIESLVFGSEKEGCLKRKVLGYLLTWSSLLKKIDCGRIKAQLEERDDYSSIIGTVTEYLEQNRFIYQMLLVIIIAYLPRTKRVHMTQEEYYEFDPALVDLEDPEHAKLMSLHTLVAFMKSFPSLARKYYQDCDKKLLDIVQPYIKQVVSPAILDNEIQKIEISQISLKESGQGEGLTFALFKSTKEITAQYTKGEVSMQLKIQLPTDYPLKGVTVDVGQQMKISARQKNKWALAIRNLLQIRNGDIISAVLLWKSNIDKEIEGIEECFICYCVLHPTDKSLPRMPCKNCKNKFHVACIRKWFKTSNKSNCPLCQSYFF